MKSFVSTVIPNVLGIICLSIFTACQSDRRLNVLEQAGENRAELEKVLQYYKDDAQKLKAAQFLIENMDAHYTLESKAISRFRQDVDSLYWHHPKQGVEFYEHAYDALLRQYNLSEEGTHKQYDTQQLKAEYLIAHIDHAFQAWTSVWNNHYDFEHFCNYVLPYRIGNEPTSDWMTYYKEKYEEKLKLLANPQGNKLYPMGVFDKLNKDYYLNIYYPKGDMPSLPLTFYDQAVINCCAGDAARCVAMFRSMGMPATIDFTPQWGDRAQSHSWAVYLPDEHKLFPFSGGEEIHTHFFNRSDGKLPKVFRKMYSKQQDMEEIVSTKETVPEMFRSNCLKDVTADYVTTYDVEAKLFPGVKDSWIYLAVFDNRNWKIVHFAERKGDKATFRNMGCDIVYLPVSFDEYEGAIPAGLPFILHADGKVQTLKADPMEKETVKLTRKYKESPRLQMFSDGIVGCKFQVATKSDFSDSLTVAVIPPMTENRFHELTFELEKPYPYFRYWVPYRGDGTMAELELYDPDGNQISPKRTFGVAERNIGYMFDGNALTFYKGFSDSNVWAAVEFEEPVQLSSVRFLPRNDDNFIREGETYQLYYWDGMEWELIKTLKGNREGVLHVENVPKNALLLLHNRTKGREERIFTYEDNRQVWW